MSINIPIKLLMIDDDPTQLLSLRMRLEGFGFVVTTQSDPRKVIDQLNTTEFDVLLIDLNMPEMSGVDLMKSISNSNYNGKFLSIAISSYNKYDYSTVAEDAGFDGYIDKLDNSRTLSGSLMKIINSILYTK